MISSTSASVGPPYQTVRIDHQVRTMLALVQTPGLICRTLPFSPRSASFCVNNFCNSALAAGSQHPRGCPGGCWFPQMKMCFSNLALKGIYSIWRKAWLVRHTLGKCSTWNM